MHTNASKGDFATDTRLLRITAIAAVVGILSTFAADFLLHLIRFFTNLFFFQTISIAGNSPAANTLGLLGHRRAGDRRTDRRIDGALRLGQDPRPRHSRSHRGDPVRQKQDVAQGRGAQAAGRRRS